MKRKSWIVPLFLTLVFLQALLVVLQRTGVALPVSSQAMGIVRLVVAVMILVVIAAWSSMEWRSRAIEKRAE